MVTTTEERARVVAEAAKALGLPYVRFRAVFAEGRLSYGGEMSGTPSAKLRMGPVWVTVGDYENLLGCRVIIHTGDQGPAALHSRPATLKWDGEWQITYETFRDMGAAYGVGLILIYLLVVAQFKSYRTPWVIMALIPLTLIGVMPGHALLGAQFTATSMIGMIALAGIIVRNSILLVDFIELQVAQGMRFEQAVVSAAAVRAQPIALTGLAAMIGAFFILDDPIFNGLAVSLIFGILVSTLLTLVVIHLLYYALLSRRS
jgi:multidrug efflux pump subunit AcrB